MKTRRGWCTHCNISQNCVSKYTRLHLSAYSFQKISGGGGLKIHQIASQCIFISKNFRRGGGAGADPLRRLVTFGHSGLLPQMINPR